jgi:hypothetical protein
LKHLADFDDIDTVDDFPIKPGTTACCSSLDHLETKLGMSFFDSIVSAIQSPRHAGSAQDLQGLLSVASMIPGLQGTGQQVQPMLNVLGSHLQDVLNQQKQTEGASAAQQTVTNLSQPGIGVQDLQNLFGADRFNGIINEISQVTGLNSQLVLNALPLVIPAVMQLLATGTHQTNPEAPNPVLNHFLGGQNGGALLNEAFQLASQFMKK